MKCIEKAINGGIAFFPFLDVSLVNSFILFKANTQGFTMNIKQ